MPFSTNCPLLAPTIPDDTMPYLSWSLTPDSSLAINQISCFLLLFATVVKLGPIVMSGGQGIKLTLFDEKLDKY